jgi:hypothetical protein
MSPNQVNCDLVRALGFDPTKVAGLVLTVSPGKMPTIQVTTYVRTADGLQTAVEMLDLAPRKWEPAP